MFRPDFIESHLQAQAEYDAQLAAWVRANVGYDPTSGELYDLATQRPLAKRKADGKMTVTLMGQRFASAVAVWFWHHESFLPGSRFRRVNGDRTDDRIENLGVRTQDGCLEGAGSRWVARAPNARRNDILGVFRTYERALAAVEAHQRGLDLV